MLGPGLLLILDFVGEPTDLAAWWCDDSSNGVDCLRVLICHRNHEQTGEAFSW